ncbi:outer membrane scaffolding protein for murein synthesis (MipA/OmpV family) [Ancylobacter aquaticus]|uniref:Outer membrane scaffolding protein for murein synthesis (MipA/OmpV family) n=1 Tax=Ancylobacter aquaticus TaxID=100 RepID=A0A4R1I5J3_ANCAQ|nr:MipA/OmpV family protein [Ancylobacter aquaticus]TCK28710.1 outer membrane scaffolding protein for murein synthesis (MipA/OmpV family) [Ancylobacter aquaticus]
MRIRHLARLGLPLACSALLLPPALAGHLAGPAATLDGGAATASAADGWAFVAGTLADWNVVLGGGVMMAPKYEGSDEFDFQPVPFITASFGEHVTVDPRGVSVNLHSLGDLTLSGQLGYDTGREQSDSDHLRGLGDIDMGGVVGATLTYERGAAEIYASIERIIGGSDGTQATLGFKLAHDAGQFRFSAGVSTTWADEDYMQAYFGVTAAQSALSGLSRYDIGAGFKRVDIELVATYAVTEHWLVRGEVGLGYLLGDAADSPVVQEAFQPSVMLLVGYRF